LKNQFISLFSIKQQHKYRISAIAGGTKIVALKEKDIEKQQYIFQNSVKYTYLICALKGFTL